MANGFKSPDEELFQSGINTVKRFQDKQINQALEAGQSPDQVVNTLQAQQTQRQQVQPQQPQQPIPSQVSAPQQTPGLPQQQQAQQPVAGQLDINSLVSQLLAGGGQQQQQVREPGFIETVSRGFLAGSGLDPDKILGGPQGSSQSQQNLPNLINALVNLGEFQQSQQGLSPAEIQREQLKQSADLAKNNRLKPNELFSKFETAAKPFVLQRDAFNRIQASAKDPSPAGDLALIFNFMKVLDPGSTVREGEFANAANSAGIPQRLRAQYNRIVDGKRLGPEQREDFVNRADRLFSNAERQFKKTEKGFRKLAVNSQLDPDLIFRDLSLERDETVTPQGTTQTQTLTAGIFDDLL